MFYIPPPAQPLIRAALAFRYAIGGEPDESVFAGFRPLGPAIRAAVHRCGLVLPRHLVDIRNLWHVRVRWTEFSAPCHQPDPARPARPGLCCFTAHTVAPDRTAAAPVYRQPDEHIGARWSEVLRGPHEDFPQMISAYLNVTEPRLAPQNSGGSVPPPPKARLLVERQIAVRVPPHQAKPLSHNIQIHPDALSRCA